MSIFYKAEYDKSNKSNTTNSANSGDAISRLAERFKSIVGVLYYLVVTLIIIVTIVGIASSGDRYGPDGIDILQFILLGTVLLIVNELTFGMIATIIQIRDNTSRETKDEENSIE